MVFYDFDKHQPILIIVSRNVAENNNQTILYFPTSPNYVMFFTTWENRYPEIASVHLKAVCCFANKHTKRIQLITWSQLNHQLFTKRSIYALIITYRRSIACYRLLPHTNRWPRLSWCPSLRQKWELFFVEPGVKSQWRILVGYFTISINVRLSAVIKLVADDISFSSTAHQRTVCAIQFSYNSTKLSNSQTHFS